ncbi:flavin reductase family protein [Nocardioides coralli]|uniref:flavin reductase family protein n=1 Tax=Nocardioides coralli TaxID=2872154 RepID=UPI001CA44187|nr:flavin reductase family protein [Nocardioides coralli]QZY27998.1 flavin reductase family protein [Nocardioides coralli]
MTIHSGHPFADPSPDPVRRLRGRVTGSVSLWTSGAGGARAGLTVSSILVAGGEPGRVLALLDPDADLTAALERTGRAVVQLLSWRHRDLAEAFAGTAPAPGGAFRTGSFEETAYGPLLTDSDTHALVTLEDHHDVGWSRLVTCAVDEVEVGDDDEPLVHRRGRFVRP